MKADTVGPWVNIYTDFGRYIEAPCVVLYFVDVEITGHLCIVGTQFQSDIRLADTVTKAIVSGKTERQLEYGMLLVGGQCRRAVDRQCLTWNVFIVSVIINKCTDRQIR